jgi:hypothetical protein
MNKWIYMMSLHNKNIFQAMRSKLEQILSQYPKLFSGKLGCYPHRKVHLDLKPEAIPSRCCPYPVPRHHEQVFKGELDWLCDIGVLSRCVASQWLSPKRMEGSDGSLIFASSMGKYCVRYTISLRYKIS